MTKQDIIDYVMTTPHNTNRAVLNSMLNQLAEGGGGGSSDFSTATVTFVKNTNYTFETAVPIIDGGQMYSCTGSGWIAGEQTVVLYKGKCEVTFVPLGGDLTITATGETEVSGNTAIVKGDCTITIS